MGEKFVIATGGTGGHIFPALSLEVALKQRGHDCLLIADKRFMNFSSKVPKSTKYKIIPSGTLNKVFGVLQVVLGIYMAIFHIIIYRPKMVISFGGYPSFPTMVAAILLRKPLMIHEQNSVMGKAHRVVMKWADIISVPFASVKGLDKVSKKKVYVVGNPVSEDISSIGRRKYNKHKDTINLLILGGSQGARILSKVIPEAVNRLKPSLRSRLRIVQQSRAEDIDSVKKKYSQLGIKNEVDKFFVDIPKKISDAHLVLCRSGASTVSELIAAARPSVLVPIAVSNHNHQLLNAKILEDNKAGWILEEKNFTPKSLADLLTYLLSNSGVLVKASSNARSLFIDSNKNMIELIEEFCHNR